MSEHSDKVRYAIVFHKDHDRQIPRRDDWNYVLDMGHKSDKLSTTEVFERLESGEEKSRIQEDRREWTRLIRSPHFAVTLSDRREIDSWILWRVDTAIHSLRNLVEVSLEKRAGTPVIMGTSFTVAQMLAELADGKTYKEVCDDFGLPEDRVHDILQNISIILDRPVKR